MTTLHYASPRTEHPKSPILGIVALLISTTSTALFLIKCVDLAQRSLMAHAAARGGCGTGIHEYFRLLMFTMPIAFTLPVGGWFLAHLAGAHQRICRCCVLVALAGWLTTLLFA
jgi:hypothetical protein